MSLAAFLALTAGVGARLSWLPEDAFSRLDPLVGLVALLASRRLIVFWATAVLTVALTIVFGRAWCGWVCPVGTLLDVLPAASPKRSRALAGSWRIVKYVVLAVIVVSAAGGTLAPMVLDPVTIVTRPVQELVRPFVGTDGVGLNAGAYISRYAFRPLALLSLLPLALVLALSAVARRGWCRILCPLGAMLALLSKVPGIRRRVDAEACTSCGRCAAVCPTDAVRRDAAFASSVAECAVCMACADECPTGAVAFRSGIGQVLGPAYRPDRRDALVTLGSTGVSLAFVGLPLRNDVPILRPPSTDERRLAELCARCGACYSACPTGSIRPSLSVTSPAGLWTPMLDERPAHCTLSCNRCARVCPTDALHTLDVWESVAAGAGAVAVVDRARCRAWGAGRSCMVCRGGCPISGALLQVEAPARNGVGTVGAPEVDMDECVGCNQCAEACVVDPPAIGIAR